MASITSHTNLLTGITPLLLLVGATVAMLALVAYPLFRTFPDDKGDGNSLVLIPPPKIPPLYRAPLFVLVFASLVLLMQGIRGSLNPSQIYTDAVTHVTSLVIHAPVEITGYLNSFTAGLRLLIAGTIFCWALLGRGTISRRLVMLLGAVWYLLLMILVDSCLSVLQAVFGVPFGPGTLLGSFIVIFFGYIAMTRTVFSSYCLPRPTAVPFQPRRRSTDALTLFFLTVGPMAVAFAGVLLVYQLANPQLKVLLPLLLPVPFAQLTVAMRTGLLAILGKFITPPEPPPGEVREPIDVIIPAFNEEKNIVDTLSSVDAAAGRHGGPVHVILCTDGATDNTAELAQATIRSFRYATGVVIEGRHGGKSAALNAALAETTSDIVVRIDGDTLVDEWSLYYLQRWFADPQIGLIEAMMWPRWNPTVYPRLRLFEELRQFGMNHRTIQLVDGVNVVPGVFTAFRRDVAVKLGGFTVGMNGEDGDFTLRFSRMGYRTHLDPRVIIYEDVPASYMEIREQRIRWTRGSIHNHSRHGPYRGGFGAPKVWFTQAHLFYSKTFRPLRLMFFLYLLSIALFEGTYRQPIVAFLTVYLVAIVGSMVLVTLLAFGYRRARFALWCISLPFWALCTTVYTVESWLSLPGRPTPLLSGGVHVEAPVIH